MKPHEVEKDIGEGLKFMKCHQFSVGSQEEICGSYYLM